LTESMRIDLHLHSTASDGAFGPTEVVSRARQAGLDVIALADHDTTAGVHEAIQAAGKGLKVIPAIEVSAAHGDRDLHILGYLVDPASPPLQEYMDRARVARQERIREMIDRLATLDVAVDFDAVLAEAGPAASSLARPHLARVMRAAGHVGSISEAFERFIGDDGPAFVAARLVDVPGAIRLIHDAGGLAVWAHPPAGLLDTVLPMAVDAGLDGIECYRPRLPEPDLKRLLRAVRRHGLLATGGSDWHGDWNGELGTFHLDHSQVGDFMQVAGLAPGATP
jgi:3',5'-nucleoside bisphosphate phosphatase